MMHKLLNIKLFILAIAVNIPANIYAQEIDFGQYSSRYTITTFLISSDINFGTVSQNQGTKEVKIDEGAVLEFEGIKYLDVIVEISVSEPFQIDGCASSSCVLPLTLKASYSNFGDETDIAALSKTIFIGESTIDFNNPTALLSAQFPILSRTSAPPGPPPTPAFEGADLEAQKESAYLFLYGSVLATGVDIGQYSTTVTVTINYD